MFVGTVAPAGPAGGAEGIGGFPCAAIGSAKPTAKLSATAAITTRIHENPALTDRVSMPTARCLTLANPTTAYTPDPGKSSANQSRQWRGNNWPPDTSA